MKVFSLFAAVAAMGAALAGCGGSSLTSTAGIGDARTTIDTVQVNGPLRLETRDMNAAAATIPFPAPAVLGATGAITASSAEFGSLCQYEVSGSSDIRGSVVGIHVLLVPRLTVCTQELRVLSYTATLTIAPGTYDVAFVRELNGGADTLVRRSVTVR